MLSFLRMISPIAKQSLAIAPSKIDGNVLINKERHVNLFSTATQFVMWPFIYIFFNVIFDIKITGKINFSKVSSPFIIVCNHISFYDSFLFRIILGLWTPHLPLRFMAVNKFNWKFLNLLSRIGVINFVYYLFGVFTIIPGKGIDKNLIKATRIIDAGGNVVIYPEGKIITEKSIGTFKKGASVLMRRTGAPAVPLSFKLSDGGFRKKVTINVGEPLKTTNDISDKQMTEMLYNIVKQLYGTEPVT